MGQPQENYCFFLLFLLLISCPSRSFLPSSHSAPNGPSWSSSKGYSLSQPSGLSDYWTWRLWSGERLRTSLWVLKKGAWLHFETFAKTAKHPKLQRWKTTAVRNRTQPWSLCGSWDHFRISIASHHNGTTMHPPEPGAAAPSRAVGEEGYEFRRWVGCCILLVRIRYLLAGSRSSNNTINFQDLKLRDGIDPCMFKTFSSV